MVPALLEEFLTPGAGVVILRNGAVAAIKGYGYADPKAGRPVTPQTVFNIGSISKTVAAWGLMNLVEEGKLELDAPVERYLTRWHLPPTEFDNSGVTLRRLLSHTAGLRLHGYPGFQGEQKLPTIEASLSGETNGSGDVRLIMPPATKWQYSGGGYTIAQLLVEEVSGKGFAEYMETEVLYPLGMRSSAYGWPPVVTANAAVPHDEVGAPIPGPRFTELAAAGLQVSLEDLARFAVASFPAATASRPISRTTLELMQTRAPVSPAYGLGYGIRGSPPRIETVGHNGANDGWMAFLEIAPSTGDGLIVLTNATNGNNVLNAMACIWRARLNGTPATCRKGIGPIVVATTVRQGIEAAVARYRELKARQSAGYAFGESQLNSAGYALLRAGRLDDAIAIFQLNVEAYPEAFNPYDSLGEAYLARGDTALAITNYRRSVELDPAGNPTGIEILKKLGVSVTRARP
jgi:CubicO group peptidase (beta-lactamase class C family)